MLVLSRRPGETIRVGDDITITVTGVNGNQVRIGIDAPKDKVILREEIWQLNQEEKNGSR